MFEREREREHFIEIDKNLLNIDTFDLKFSKELQKSYAILKIK